MYCPLINEDYLALDYLIAEHESGQDSTSDDDNNEGVDDDEYALFDQDDTQRTSKSMLN